MASSMREDQRSITVKIGETSLGVFAKRSGGSIDSEEGKYAPGAMAPQISLGGRVTVENVTVARMWDIDRDGAFLGLLKGAVGKGSVVCTDQPLDVDGNPRGKPVVWWGVLKQFTFPDADAASNDPAEFQLEISSHGAVG